MTNARQRWPDRQISIAPGERVLLDLRTRARMCQDAADIFLRKALKAQVMLILKPSNVIHSEPMEGD